MAPFPPAALPAIMLAGRYRPGGQHHHDGFLQSAFAASPWLGAIVIALIVLAGLVLAVIKWAGRVLDDAPWYVRLALLVTAGFGIFRLLSGNRGTASQAPRGSPGG